MDELKTEEMTPCVVCQGRGYIDYYRGRLHCQECNSTGMVPLEKVKREERVRKTVFIVFVPLLCAAIIVSIIGYALEDPFWFICVLGEVLLSLLALVIIKVRGKSKTQ